MKKAIIITAIASIFLTLLGACSSPVNVVPGPTTAPSPAPAPPGFSEEKGLGGSIIPSAGVDRRIVRNADLQLVVKDVVAARDSIAGLAQRLGGYVVSSNASGELADIRASISIRIPDDNFEQALSEIRSISIRVRQERINSQDVTQEYIDLQARLKNAEATEAQYLVLLNKATTVEETLKVYDSLSRVRSEIEQLKGRIQYLEQITSMSLINVSLEPDVVAKPIAEPGWKPLEIIKSAARGLVSVGQGLFTLIIWIIFLIPLWAIIFGIYWGIRWLKRRGKKSKTS